MRQARLTEAGDKPKRQFRSKMIQIRVHAMKTVNSTAQQKVTQWVQGPPRGNIS